MFNSNLLSCPVPLSSPFLVKPEAPFSIQSRRGHPRAAPGWALRGGRPAEIGKAVEIEIRGDRNAKLGPLPQLEPAERTVLANPVIEDWS